MRKRAQQSRVALVAREPMIVHLTILNQTERLLLGSQYLISLKSVAHILFSELSQPQKFEL